MKEYSKQVMHSAIAHHHLTDAQPVPELQPPTSFVPSLYTKHDTIQGAISLWPLCPCCVPSQLSVPPQPHGRWGGVKNRKVFVSWCKPCLATSENSSELSTIFSS